MKITKSQFKNLPEGEKASVALSQGRQISKRRTSHFYVNLYSLEDFMVEIWYHAKRNKIESIEIIEDMAVLDKYIDEEINRKKTS